MKNKSVTIEQPTSAASKRCCMLSINVASKCASETSAASSQRTDYLYVNTTQNRSALGQSSRGSSDYVSHF